MEQTGDRAIIADFAELLVERVVELIGSKEVEKVVGIRPDRGFLGLGADKAAIALAAEEESQLKQQVAAMIGLIANAFGVDVTERHLEDIYTRLEKKRSPALANSLILPLIPPEFLEKYRLHYLSKDELEARVIEQARQVRELSELDKRKSEFLSVVAHQLRTPLTGIKWALNILLQEDAPPPTEAQKKLIRSCQEGNERMIAIVNQMLQADRVSTGAFDVKPVATDLVALIESAIKEVQLAAEERQVTITFTHDALPSLMLDPELMHFAFQNLFDNAIKYGPEHSAVEVRAELKGESVVVSVADHGIGIPLDQQPYIFSRFFRAKNAISAQPNGNGLGLSIVKSILEKHGGTTSFTTEENKGTTFYCTLPVNHS